MIAPFFLGIAAAVVAKPVMIATYRGCVRLKTEAQGAIAEAKAEVASEQVERVRSSAGTVDSAAVQTLVESAVSRAVDKALSRQASQT